MLKKAILYLTFLVSVLVSNNLYVCGQIQQIRQPMTGAEIANELSKYLEKLAGEDKFSGVLLVAKDGKPIFQRKRIPTAKELATWMQWRDIDGTSIPDWERVKVPVLAF